MMTPPAMMSATPMTMKTISSTGVGPFRRAILVGRVKRRAATLELAGDPADPFYDRYQTLYRVVLPVEEMVRTFPDEQHAERDPPR